MCRVSYFLREFLSIRRIADKAFYEQVLPDAGVKSLDEMTPHRKDLRSGAAARLARAIKVLSKSG